MPKRLDIAQRLHRRMLEIVGTALPLITSSIRDADLVGLTHLREEMVEAMEAYCRHVHRLRDGAQRLEDRERAGALVAECTSLQAAYQAFRARWAHREGMEHWPEYRLSAIVMMKQVRNQVYAAETLREGLFAQAA